MPRLARPRMSRGPDQEQKPDPGSGGWRASRAGAGWPFWYLSRWLSENGIRSTKQDQICLTNTNCLCNWIAMYLHGFKQIYN